MVVTKSPLTASNEAAKNIVGGIKCAKELKGRQKPVSFYSNRTNSCRWKISVEPKEEIAELTAAGLVPCLPVPTEVYA